MKHNIWEFIKLTKRSIWEFIKLIKHQILIKHYKHEYLTITKH